MSNKDSSLAHISEKPWSDYTAADYTPEQWHAACLIHQHEGTVPYSKDLCKLPVRTPNGALNRNGVHAAAAALAGARGGVIASAEQKASAAKALIGLYKQLNEKPPPSLIKHSDVDDFLAHHGIKGMKWGVRRSQKQLDSASSSGTKSESGSSSSITKSETDSSTKHEPSDIHISADAERFVKTRQKAGHEMSDDEIKKALNRARMVEEYNNMFNPNANQQLKKQVEHLQLRKSFTQLHRELNPSKLDRVSKLVKSSSTAFDAFKSLDDSTGHAMTNKFKDTFSLSYLDQARIL